jgi:hypothetical protein
MRNAGADLEQLLLANWSLPERIAAITCVSAENLRHLGGCSAGCCRRA